MGSKPILPRNKQNDYIICKIKFQFPETKCVVSAISLRILIFEIFERTHRKDEAHISLSKSFQSVSWTTIIMRSTSRDFSNLEKICKPLHLGFSWILVPERQ